MGRCGHHARCYVQLLLSEHNHSSNGLANGVSLMLLSAAIATGRWCHSPVATEDHINHTQNFSPTSPAIIHVNYLINPQQYDLVEDV
jgi:hypothetical protein